MNIIRITIQITACLLFSIYLSIYCSENEIFHTRTLYLDLMKKCLINSIYEDPGIMGNQKGYFTWVREMGRDWPLQAHTMIGLQRLDNLQFCIIDVITNNVEGDLIETGVWRGGATIFMRAILKAYAISNKVVWVADSFQGLPAPDKNYPADKNLDLSDVKILAVPLEDVQANFKKYNLLDEQVKFLKGWFKDTLPTAPINKLSILRLDGDLYESTIQALNYLYPKLSIGGYVIIDDFFAAQQCKEAVTAYRAQHNINELIINIDNIGVYWKKQS